MRHFTGMVQPLPSAPKPLSLEAMILSSRKDCDDGQRQRGASPTSGASLNTVLRQSVGGAWGGSS